MRPIHAIFFEFLSLLYSNTSNFISLYSTAFLTEDGLLDMILASNPAKAPVQEESKRPVVDKVAPLPKKSPQKIEAKSMSQINMCTCF